VKHLILALTVLLLAACSGGLRSGVPTSQVYILRATTEADQEATATGTLGSVQVARPTAGPGLDSEHIIIVQPDHRMSYYAGSRWSADVPLLVEELTVERLRASGAWDVVNNSTSNFSSEYYLQITIRRFEAEYASDAAPTVRVVLDCEIGRRESPALLASFSVAGDAAASANRAGAVVSAFEQAANAALTQLAQKSAAAVKNPQARSTP
jgi:cholesterol transport system auxiliary component